MSLTGVAQETLAIVDAGHYVAPSGRKVDVRAAVDAAVRGTVLYRPEELDALLRGLTGDAAAPPPRITVTGETTGAAARRLSEAGKTDLLALNFASAKNPGGGFLRGAKAQEEDLSRCSALYTCQLPQRRFYETHRASPSMLYSDHMIYSPAVPFFRGEDLALLETPFVCSVITSAAPNAAEVARKGTEGGLVVPTLMRRARQVLGLAAARKHRVLILGAWGCGVFGNDPTQAAEAFAQLRQPIFAGAFDEIVFAVYERAGAQPNRRAFERRFAG